MSKLLNLHMIRNLVSGGLIRICPTGFIVTNPYFFISEWVYTDRIADFPRIYDDEKRKKLKSETDLNQLVG